MAPKDEQELRDMLHTAVEYKSGPIAIRYPRGNAVGVPMRKEFRAVPIGTGETLRRGRDVAILTIGTVTNEALAAAEELAQEGIEAEVVHMRFVKPIDRRLLEAVATRIPNIITIEDNVVAGGFGSAVIEELQHIGMSHVAVRAHGHPDEHVEHGSPSELYRMLKLDAPGIATVVREFIESRRDVNSKEFV